MAAEAAWKYHSIETFPGVVKINFADAKKGNPISITIATEEAQKLGEDVLGLKPVPVVKMNQDDG